MLYMMGIAYVYYGEYSKFRYLKGTYAWLRYSILYIIGRRWARTPMGRNRKMNYEKMTESASKRASAHEYARRRIIFEKCVRTRACFMRFALMHARLLNNSTKYIFNDTFFSFFFLQRDALNLEPTHVANCVSKGKSEVSSYKYCRLNKINFRLVQMPFLSMKYKSVLSKLIIITSI